MPAESADAYNPAASHLPCQLVLTSDKDGLTLTIAMPELVQSSIATPQPQATTAARSNFRQP